LFYVGRQMADPRVWQGLIWVASLPSMGPCGISHLHLLSTNRIRPGAQ
jgi:hypothetical protein